MSRVNGHSPTHNGTRTKQRSPGPGPKSPTHNGAQPENGGSHLVNGKPRLPPINTPASILSSRNSRDYSKSKLMTHRRANEMQGLLMEKIYQKAEQIREDVQEKAKKRPPSANDPDYPLTVSTVHVFRLHFFFFFPVNSVSNNCLSKGEFSLLNWTVLKLFFNDFCYVSNFVLIKKSNNNKNVPHNFLW